MPRLKPPRPEALAPKPEPTPTDDVTFNLDAPMSEPIALDLTPEPVEEPVVTKTQPAPVAVEPPAHDDAVKRILEATQRADTLQRQLADEQRRATAREQELSRDRDDAQYNSILTSIAAEQTAMEKAKGDLTAFANAGDWSNFAAAQSELSVAASRLDRLNDNKQAFEGRREEMKRQAPEPVRAAPAPASVDQEIDTLNVPAEAKSYLRQHPELMTDQSKRKRLGNIHNYITDARGVAAFTPEYFETLDRELGYATTTPGPTPSPAPGPARRSMPVAAPVSREVPTASGQRNANQITLTPEQREVARNAFGSVRGAPDLTNAQKERLYAENLQRLNRMRASGEYRQTTEQTG